uniref:transposase n=1 Tax=Crinalium epipsammum TaxID=241425 RepID=UPI000312125C|nr:transposase [Crinalium epipsammum]
MSRRLPERTQSVIKEVMLKWGEKVLYQIKEVSMDMTGNYKSWVSQLCPNADVTIDRFYV